MSDEQQAYSRDEAARLYGVSLSVIERAIHRGDLRAKKVGRKYRIDLAALRDWFNNLPDA